MDASRRGTPNVLAIVLAGGEGRRLWPLTEDRAKPAVPIAGRYRLIDFALSNFVNSGLLKIKVLTQYKSDSLNTHIARGWRMPAFLDYYCELVPAQQRVGRDWFKGSADALHQSMNIILDERPDHTAVFGGDHMYKMDVRQMLEFHREREADVTVAVIPVPRDEARAFGVLAVDGDGRVLEFQEKPAEPRLMPGSTDMALASMGNYIFTTPALLDELGRDALGDSAHDFGRNILPMMVERGMRVFAYDFAQNQIAGEEGTPYWRDVGTIQSYWQANMDLCAVLPAFNLYNARWPIRTWTRPLPPAKFVFADSGEQTGVPRVGIATDSLVSEGCIVSGGRLHRCVVSPEVRINSFASVEESVILHGVDVGRHAKIRRAILDKDVRIPPGTEIGYDLEADKRRFVVSDGIVVVPKGYDFENPRPLRSPQ